MANENLVSNLEFIAEAATAIYFRSLADRAVLPAHASILQLGPTNALQSITGQGRVFGVQGADLYVSRTEIQSQGNTEISVDDFSCAVGRHSLVRSVSGTAFDADPVLEPAFYAQDLIVGALATETNLCAGLATSFTNISGAAAVDMSLVTFLEALTALELRNVSGPYMFLGHTAHFAGMRLEQLLTVGGMMQYAPPAGISSEVGYLGQLLGVDLFKTNRAPDDGAGKAGFMAGAGAILRNHQNPSITNTGEQAAVGNIKIFNSYVGNTDVKTWGGHLYVGYKIQDADGDDRGQRIRCAI